MSTTIETFETPDGTFTLVADADGAVLGSGWTDDPQRVIERIHPSLRSAATGEGTTAAGDAARAYYAGDLAAIDAVAVRQHGTEMQLRGWKTLRGIRPGEPLGYSEFAAALGSPGAARAAASICARNAPALFVPCHRVLRSDGTLGGFAWGLDVKRALLAREAATAR